MTEHYKYWAFISYSHQDRAWGDWLHKTLETYRVPRRLIGRASRDGEVPARLFPVFRDRDELPSSANLGDVLNESLRQSRYQIVICSPRSAASRWVNEEIKYFKSLGREDRVLCLIVDGEPNVFDLPGRDIDECFAPALRYRVDAQGQITDIPAEPIAADAREHADGKRGAKLKLLSGLLGVGLDELVQRERQREFWKRVQIGAAAMAFAGLCLGAWQGFQNERAAREREIVIEKLVENGRLELLAGQHARAAVYLNEAYKMGHDTVPLRFMLAQAMKPVEALTDVRVEHGGQTVFASSFSPDGTRFALHVLVQGTAEQKAVVKIYDAVSAQQIFELSDAPALPLGIDFSSDGERLLMTGFPDDERNGTPFTQVWSLAESTPSLRIDGVNGLLGRAVHPDGSRLLVASETGLQIHDTLSSASPARFLAGLALSSAAYSPDGSTIATASADGIVYLIDAESGRIVSKLMDAAGQKISAVLFSPDGKDVLALLGDDYLPQLQGDIRVWSVDTGVLRLSFAAEADRLNALRFSRDGRRYATVGSEGYKVWSAARGVLLFSVPRSLTPYASAALSPDGNTLITTDFQNRVAEAWDVRSKRLLHTLDLHTDGVSSAAFDHEGQRLLLASNDGTAEIWRLPADGAWKYESFDTLPYVTRYAPKGDHLLVGGGSAAGGRAFVLDPQTGMIERQFVGHEDLVADLQLDARDGRLVTASLDGTAALWDFATSVRLATMSHSAEGTLSARFSGNGDRVLSTTSPNGSKPDDDAAILWDARDGALIARLEHTKFVYAATFNQHGSEVATASLDGTLKLWSADDGRELRSWPGNGDIYTSIAFSPDRKQLAAAARGVVRLLNPASGAEIVTLREAGLDTPETVMYSPDGQQIAVSTQSGSIWLWEVTGQTMRILKGHRQLVDSLAYNRQGTLLFSGGMDGEVRAWDTSSGMALGVLMSFPRKVHLDLHPDDTQLVATAWSQIAVADVRSEGRNAAQIARVLICKAPWSITSGPSLAPERRSRQQC